MKHRALTKKVPFVNLYNGTIYKLIDGGNKYEKIGHDSGILHEGSNSGSRYEVDPSREVYVREDEILIPSPPPPPPEKKKVEKPQVTVDYLGIKFKEGFVNRETIEQLTTQLALLRKKARLYKRFSKEYGWRDSK